MTARTFNFLRHKLPLHQYGGLALIAVAWPIAWLHVTPFSYFSFLYLWLGYILTVDGIKVTTFVLSWISPACLVIGPPVEFGFNRMWLLLVLDPLNVWLDRPSLLRQVKQGDSRNV